VVRATALSVTENIYVEAVSALGATRRRVVLQHILPNVLAPWIIIVTAQLAGAILAEAALSYLGLGAAEPTPRPRDQPRGLRLQPLRRLPPRRVRPEAPRALTAARRPPHRAAATPGARRHMAA
jgi:binding-protein-dependent transport system inner membrane component